MSQYRISPTAIRDLNEIGDYFLTNSVAAGERFF
ncbi:MAG: type II toxin-antitoxin system RelE/ParE family toxin [Cyanobacteria bacterium P01_E01_bin.42]